MSRHIRIECPNCRRTDLRIRPEYLGRRVTCKHCGFEFPARAADDSGTPPTSAGHPPAEQAAIDEAEPRATAPGGEVERIRAELATRTGEYTATLRRLQDVEGRLGESEDRARGLQEGLDRAHGQLRRDSERRDELAEAVADRARLLAEVEVLRVRAAAADRLEGDHRTDRAEIDALAAELRSTREHLARFDPQAAARRGSWRPSAPSATSSGENSRASGTSSRPAVSAARPRSSRPRRRGDRLEVDRLAGSLLEDRDRAALQEEVQRIRREADAARAEVESLTRERDDLAARHDEAERATRGRAAASGRGPDQADSAVRRDDELGERIRTLRDELERQRDHEAEQQRLGDALPKWEANRTPHTPR
ncbi:MAG: hypothetical protein WKF75_17150 [Singulisphaera sp.]